MADVKISALTNLGATPANDDELVIVDKDGGGASGTTKRVTVSDLLSGVGSALTVTDGVSPVSDVSQITVAGDITLTDDTGGLVTISATDTTYTITTVDSGDDALIRLNDGSTNDDITIAAGSGITIDHTTDTITISAAAGTTINNNADNRLITGSGTANTLEGEANLTYDGQLLDIKNDGTDQSEIRLYCESSNAHYVGIAGAPDAGAASHILQLPLQPGTAGQVLSVDSVNGSTQQLIFSDVSAAALTGQVVSYEVSSDALDTAGEYEGQVVKIGSDTDLVAGDLYYWSGTSWDVADNSAESTAKGPLGIALGANSATNGVLTQGVYYYASPPGSNGSLLYLGTTGDFTAAAPVTNGKILRVLGQRLDANKVLFQPSQDYVELGTPTGSVTVVGQEVDFATSDTALDTAGEAEGTVVKFGTGTTAPGKVYVYQGTAWAEADATGEATTKGLLGLALGTAPATDGMLTNGLGYLSAAPTAGSDGDVLYLSDTATGTLTATQPADSTDFVRVAGYQVGAQKVYFSPSQDYIDLA